MEHWESEREGEMEDGTVVAMRRVFNKDKRGFSVDKVRERGKRARCPLITSLVAPNETVVAE